jgi:hypothetical protein
MASYDEIFIQDHDETYLIQFWDVFHEIWVKMSFAICGEKVCLMEFNERKSFEVDGNNALCLRNKWEV